MLNNHMNSRLKGFNILIIIIFLFILYQFYDYMILKNGSYIKKLDELSNVIVEGDTAPRGRIYDRNYKLLVDNKAIPTVVYKRESNMSMRDEIDLCYRLISILDMDYSKVTNRNLKEFIYATSSDHLDYLITDEEWDKLKLRILSNTDIYNLKIMRISDLDISMLNDNDRKVAYLYYLMNNGYSYSNKVIKKNISDVEYSIILENISEYPGISINTSWERNYLYGDTLRQILGSVGSITKETKDYYLGKGYQLSDTVGLSYLERQYDDILRGTKATYLKTSSSHVEKLTDEIRGDDIVLSIDIDLQIKVDEILKEQILRAKGEANTEFFNKSYAVIQEPNTGEVLAISGVQIIKVGREYKFVDVTNGVIMDSFVPGSVVKGASMIVGYNTGAISINEYVKDECLKIKSTPLKCSSHEIGIVNDIEALAESSNVYQFKIAIKVGGGIYSYNSPLKLNMDAFDIYRNTFGEFGLGVMTGIDLPNEATGYKGKTRNANLLLNFAIGQYDNYTPIELSQYITTIASNGNRLQPHLLKEIHYATSSDQIGELKELIEPTILNKVNTKDEYLDRIKLGFIAVLDHGTGRGVINKDYLPAGKTGTSESFLDTNHDGVIDTETVSTTFVAYAPYDNPVMTIAVVSPDVENPHTSVDYRSYVNRRIAKQITNYYFSR